MHGRLATGCCRVSTGHTTKEAVAPPLIFHLGLPLRDVRGRLSLKRASTEHGTCAESIASVLLIDAALLCQHRLACLISNRHLRAGRGWCSMNQAVC